MTVSNQERALDGDLSLEQLAQALGGASRTDPAQVLNQFSALRSTGVAPHAVAEGYPAIVNPVIAVSEGLPAVVNPHSSSGGIGSLIRF